jgi:hypothetical protein
MKTLILLLFSFGFIYSQEITVMNEKKILHLDEKAGLVLLKKEGFTKCLNYKEDNENIYYEGYDKGYLIFNKYLKDFILYNSKLDFEKVFFSKEILDDVHVDFEGFEDNITYRVKRLSNILDLKISLNDKKDYIKMIDLKIKEDEKIKQQSFFFIDLFSYYYVVLKNELGYLNFEIQESDEGLKFFIFGENVNNKKELFKDFYRFLEDIDNEYDLSVLVENVINPVNLQIGSIESPR